ncbi:MAG: hypothetical protein ABI433_07240 [Burkholderiaceae bacterium]
MTAAVTLDVVIDMLASLGKADRDMLLSKLDTLRAVIDEHPPGLVDAAYVFGEALQRFKLQRAVGDAMLKVMVQ